MDTEIIWLAPLLILPGIALLINSTSSRYATLHEEIHHWLDGRHDEGVVRPPTCCNERGCSAMRW